MNVRGIGIIAGVAALALLIVGISQLSAQREPGPGPHGPTGRYQLVRIVDRPGGAVEIIILDTATGDLFAAGPGDVKPYSQRPRPGADFKDKAFKDRPKVDDFKDQKVDGFKDKKVDGFKDKEPIKEPRKEEIKKDKFKD